ncbi:hypothetical protein [Microbacterium sp.]|uniref:hypothetical protein n=1 Tax=Microbacterium sp. TaxID=51671 RepID=UPI000B362BBA|nr:hypothetical protein CIK77_04560 [Microbacterium sp. JB110]
MRFDHAVRRGELRRVRSGVYVPSHDWEQLPPWDRYLVRVHAFALKAPYAVLTHESAAALWGLPLLGAQPHIHAIAPRSGDARLVGDVQWHHLKDEPDVVTTPGAALTPPVDTVVNLARSRHPAVARVAADALLRLGDCSSDLLLDANESRQSKRGRAAARWPLTTTTPLPESPLETLSIVEIEWLGFEAPELQVSVGGMDGNEYRVDCFWRRADIIGEADGRSKYTLDGQLPERAVWLEKRREDVLRRSASGFTRWIWEDVGRPTRLQAILRAVGVPEVRVPRWEPLRTLAAIL